MTPWDVRKAVFLRMCDILDQAEDRVTDTHQSVWSSVSMIPRPRGHYNLRKDRDSILWSRIIGAHAFNYSIAIRLGEVRIGVILPHSLNADLDDRALASLGLYPSVGQGFPYPIARSLSGLGWLFDFIFTERLGSLTLTRDLLSLQSLHDPLIEVMADALAHEVIHINHGIMHLLTERGFLVREDFIVDSNNMACIEVTTKKTVMEIARILEIEPSRIYRLDDDRYFLFAPNEGAEYDRMVFMIRGGALE